MPRLIINADDFGLTSGVNRAIAEGVRAGAITSATLMANSQAFDEAVTLACRIPGLKIGCHVVLIDGVPLTRDVPSLTEDKSRFRASLKDFAWAAMRNQISQDEVQHEAEAQIRKIQSAGISVTHVDTHKHTHIFPHVLRPVLRAAKACGVCAIRNPFEPFRAWPTGMIVRKPSLWLRAVEVALLQKFARSFRQIVANEGMITTEGSAGVVITGVLTQESLEATIHAMPEGTWELVCHPGYADAELYNAGTRLLESRHTELEALVSEKTTQARRKRGIELISYADLAISH